MHRHARFRGSTSRCLRSAIVALALSLVATACAASVTSISEGSTGSGTDERTEQPQLRAAGESSAAVMFDRLVMERFPEASHRELGIVEHAIQAHCLGVMGLTEIQLLPLSPAIAQRVVEVDTATCDEVAAAEVYSFDSEPTGATTWLAAVEARRDRVVWWGTEAEFEAHAARICTTLPDRLDIDPLFELSASATVELVALMRTDECRLLHTPDAATAPTVSLESAGPVDRDFFVFYGTFTRRLTGGSTTNLHRFHVGSGEVLDLTDTVADGLEGVTHGRLGISPDGRSIAFLVEEEPRHQVLYIADLEGNRHRVGELDSYDMTWSSDGSEILFSASERINGELVHSVEAIAIRDGARRTLHASTELRRRVRGAHGGFVYVEESRDEPEQYRFVRLDESDGSEHDAIDIGFAGWHLGARHAFYTKTGGSDPGTLGLIDLESPTLVPQELPTAHGHEGRAVDSPDGRFVAYAAGPRNKSNRIVVAPILDLAASVTLVDVSDGQWISAFEWTPDSRGIVFRAHEGTIHLASLDGTIEDLGVDGVPIDVGTASSATGS